MKQEVNAQTAHNFAQCYLNKNWKPNTEGVNCPACRNKIDKEKSAKQAEQKRRDDAIAAKIKAENEAKEKAFAAEQQRKRDEIAQKKQQEENDKLAQEALRKKSNQIAEQGKIKSAVRGKEILAHPEIDKIEVFSDKTRRVYGFKVDGIETKVLPFEGYNTHIERIQKSNLFHVRVYSSHPKYGWDVYSHSYLINHLGKKLIIDGIDKFDVEIGVFENTIFLIKWLQEPQIIDITVEYCYRQSYGVFTIYDSQSSAISALESLKITYGGLAMCFSYKVCNVNQYKVDFDGKLLEKNEGYQLFSFRK
jgi:hypothetical protein